MKSVKETIKVNQWGLRRRIETNLFQCIRPSGTLSENLQNPIYMIQDLHIWHIKTAIQDLMT